MSAQAIIDGYARDADDQIAKVNSIEPVVHLAPVAAWLPTAPSDVLDVGAGPGRNAAWFAAHGHRVIAVEPVQAFREAGARRDQAVIWLDDRLPGLAGARALDRRFDLVLLTAVWQHLDRPARQAAMPALAALTAPGGRLIISLRHGPGAMDRPVFPCDPQETVDQAAAKGLTELARMAAPSVQAANTALGVHWTWLVLGR